METKKVLKNALIICLTLHICFLLILQFIFGPQYYRASGHTLWDDGETFSSHARIISYTLLNKLPDKKIKIKYPDLKPAVGEILNYAQEGLVAPVNAYQVGYITYFYSLIYATFGYRPILINLMNILLNLLTGIIIFKICKMIFNEKVGCIALILFLFNPILFHYVTTKVAESVYIFIIYIFIYCVILFSKEKLYYLLPSIVTVFLIFLFKKIYFFPLLLVFLTYILIQYFVRYKRFFLFSMVLVYIILLLSNKIVLVYSKIINIFTTAAYHNLAYQTSGGLTYNLILFGKDYHDYSIFQWFLYFINAWYHMLVEPLKPNSILYLFYYPLRVIFLFLCFFAFLGLFISIRLKKKETILLLIFYITIGSIIAIGSGNVGTMLRHRDIITPIVFIFSSVYLSKFFSFDSNNVK